MKLLFKGLDTETQLLVALGSAVASGCIPCLENISGMARAEGIEEKKLKAAAIIGQFIKDQPAANMKATADKPLGTHLQSAKLQTGCPEDSIKEETAEEYDGNKSAGGGVKSPFDLCLISECFSKYQMKGFTPTAESHSFSPGLLWFGLRPGCRATKSHRSPSESTKLSGAPGLPARSKAGLPVGLHRRHEE